MSAAGEEGRRYQEAPYLGCSSPLYAEKDVAHGVEHIQRILKRLEPLTVGQQLQLRWDLLYFLACFHGVADRMAEPGVRRMVKQLLTGLGWSDREITEGLAALARHLVDPHTSEENVVHDANYLEAVGALGIAKAFTTGGARGQSYERTLEIARRNLDRPVFRTTIGRRLAAERRAYAHDFLDRLARELGPVQVVDDQSARARTGSDDSPAAG
ncbi:HD domain-containing protein [Peterkaempfera bronchialis]|uniref:HD domain-containing protein n=1 Tax=Peterkaempfera bronchialis TaxID=2126346 RepID=A0A345SUA5_9ACTN|nr:hypothetical protein [Peterkaempfera bronchialis]AXI77310.1 hypothetical protein C7M71_007485 [Peterkaempfera bronchialis]